MTYRLERLEQMLEEATPGPWRYDDGWNDRLQRPTLAAVMAPLGSSEMTVAAMGRLSESHPDARLIATLRNLAPHLLRVMSLVEDVKWRMRVVSPPEYEFFQELQRSIQDFYAAFDDSSY